jgi:hypothetical protein
MGQKFGLIAIAVLVVFALMAANSFGFLGVDDLVYAVKLIAGWTAYVAVIAIVYAGVERLMPGILCTAAPEDTASPPPAG